MARFNRPAKIDKNQPEVVKLYRRCGALVLLTHTLKNCCDIIVTYQGKTMHVEIKDPEAAGFPQYFWNYRYEQRETYIVKNHLTPGEKEFREKVLQRNGIYHIVYDPDTVLRSLGITNHKSNNTNQ